MPTLATGVLGITGLIAKGINPSSSVSQDLQIWGLSHLVGKTVSAFVDGQDTGDFTVAADGSITVDISTTSHTVTAATLIASDDDYGESTTPVYIANGGAAVWTNVGIVVGLPFVSSGQRLRPATREDVRAESGPALGMIRRSPTAAILVQDAVVVKFGTLLDPSPYGNMFSSDFKQADGVTAIAVNTMFSGVHTVTLDDGYSFDSQFCWRVDRPWPCSILAITQFLGAEERGE